MTITNLPELEALIQRVKTAQVLKSLQVEQEVQVYNEVAYSLEQAICP